jgi:hypothetical protein
VADRRAAAAQIRPSFALYLAGLLLLPLGWFSPFSYAQAGWADVLFGVAAAVWLLEGVRDNKRIRLRAPHYCYAAYAGFVVLSAIATSESRGTAAQNVLITLELVALAVLTADYARSASNRRVIARVVLAVVLITAVEAVVGLALFYLGHSSSLITGYSSYFKSSHLYTRVEGGFYSAPLLGNFTIFASSIIAMDDSGLPRRVKLAAQVVLGLLVLSTISRPVIGFAIAIAIREAHRRRTPTARRLATAVVIGGLAVAIGLTVVPLSADPLRPASSTATINPRLSMIEKAARTLAHHPLLGKGPGSLVASWQGQPLRAHLTPLNIAATTGVLSLVPLVALIIILWRQRRLPTDVALWSGAAGLAVDALTQDVEHFRQVWLMLGMLDAGRTAADSSAHSSPAADRAAVPTYSTSSSVSSG